VAEAAWISAAAPPISLMMRELIFDESYGAPLLGGARHRTCRACQVSLLVASRGRFVWSCCPSCRQVLFVAVEDVRPLDLYRVLEVPGEGRPAKAL
jgi:hypothetical protein